LVTGWVLRVSLKIQSGKFRSSLKKRKNISLIIIFDFTDFQDFTVEKIGLQGVIPIFRLAGHLKK